MLRRIADHIKQGELQRILTLLCRHTGMLLCFNWKVFKYVAEIYWNMLNIYIQMLSDYTLI